MTSGAQCQVRSRYSTCTSDITYGQCKLVTIALHSLAFPPSSVWLLAVCKNRGGRPGPFYHMNDVSVYLGRQLGEGSPITTHFVHVFFVSWYVFCFVNVRNSSTWGRNYKIRPQARSFDGGLLPPSVYLGRHWHHGPSDSAVTKRLCMRLSHAITNTWSHVHVHIHM